MSYRSNNCCNNIPVEYYQSECPYCQVENYQFDNFQSQPVVENFDFFGWWPWMPRSKCSCPRKNKKWYDLGSLTKGGCPKECRYKQCNKCPEGHVQQTIHLKHK